MPAMRLHPFRVLVREELTLSDIATRNDTTISDLLLANPDLAHQSATAWLPHGTVVHLPPTLSLRGRPFGDMFAVRDATAVLAQVMQRWTLALERRLAGAASKPLPVPPQRKVVTKPELLDQAVVAEVLRQRPAVLRQARQKLEPSGGPDGGGGDDADGPDESQLTMASIAASLDNGPLEAAVDDIKRLFHETSGLVALKLEHAAVMEKVPLAGRRNVVTSSTEHTVRDTAGVCDPGCAHVAELQWAFLEANKSRDVVERWLVLPCQPLTALVDALQCKMRLLPYPHSKNSVLFIAGAFYVDDRHDGFDDLSLPIRDGMPSNTAYKDCGVFSMSKTTFAELTVKLHEYCVFRHFGQCDHYFFLDDIVPLVGGGEAALTTRGVRSDYPRRSFLAPSAHMPCQICQQLPATIVTWGDRLAPTSPFLMCPPCFRLFHADANDPAAERDNDYVKFELPPGEHF